MRSISFNRMTTGVETTGLEVTPSEELALKSMTREQIHDWYLDKENDEGVFYLGDDLLESDLPHCWTDSNHVRHEIEEESDV